MNTPPDTKPGHEVPPAPAPLHLFEAYGVELEYMIVDRRSLDVRPVADRLIEAVAGEVASEVEFGDVAWSNELALHVLELKTNGPAPRLEGLAELFQAEVRRADAALEPLGARLLPTGMHPWMDPFRELRLWPHEYNEVYRTFDRIFGCRGHGWANLQSTHVNLPFEGDEEFARLHGAIRLVLPLVPALAASSPVHDGRLRNVLDARLLAYRNNARRVPSVTGSVVPEPASSRAEYEQRILGPVYRDLAPLDPEGVLRHEWVNARGAIARFGRGSIEIRVIDAQEAPVADLAIVTAVSAVVRDLTASGAGTGTGAVPTEVLASVLEDAVRRGSDAVLAEPSYRRALALDAGREPTVGEAWRSLLQRTVLRNPGASDTTAALDLILEEGCLASRIRRAVGPAPSRARLLRVYRRLADCLHAGVVFR